jgi:hypothetical protein
VIKTWCIPPEQNASYVAAMEEILDVYARPPDPTHPVICFDECCKELQHHLRSPIRDGGGAKVDTEYGRDGMAPLHVWIEPQTGRMGVRVTEHRTKMEFAEAMRALLAAYPQAERVTVVLDNLNTHRISSLYAAFSPPEAAALRRRLKFVYTPKHGSWLNMAEIAISVLSRAVLKDQRFPTQAMVAEHVTAWVNAHNRAPRPYTWTFDVDKARAKMPRVYPLITPDKQTLSDHSG